MDFLHNVLNESQSRISVYSEGKDCPETKKIKTGLTILEMPHKIYYLNVDFTLEEFKQAFGEDASLPKTIYNKNDAL